MLTEHNDTLAVIVTHAPNYTLDCDGPGFFVVVHKTMRCRFVFFFSICMHVHTNRRADDDASTGREFGFHNQTAWTETEIANHRTHTHILIPPKHVTPNRVRPQSDRHQTIECG